jgi:aspartate ammonia-lyase
MAARGVGRGRRTAGDAAPFDGPVRSERDRLGAREVPAAALWGIHTLRSLENLAFSGRQLGSMPAYVWGLAAVKRAAARANREAGVLMPRLAEAIEGATAPLLAAEMLEHFPVDPLGGGGSIGVHMNVNEVVANLANEALGAPRGAYDPVTLKMVSASQSTADVCHTAVRLALLREGRGLAAALGGLARTLGDLEKKLAPVSTLARTCLQDAMTTTLGTLFGGFARLIERRGAALGAAIDELRAVALGGTVIGQGEGAPAAYRKSVIGILAEVTEMDLRQRPQLPDAMQNGDDLGAVSAAMRLLAEALIKIARDLRLLASGPRGGFGEIVLPHVQEGSSFFAGKSNPVVPETVMQCGFQVLGCDRAVQAAMEQAELYLDVFDGVAAVNLLDAAAMLSGGIRRLDERCLRGLAADEARCRELAKLGA